MIDRQREIGRRINEETNGFKGIEQKKTTKQIEQTKKEKNAQKEINGHINHKVKVYFPKYAFQRGLSKILSLILQSMVYTRIHFVGFNKLRHTTTSFDFKGFLVDPSIFIKWITSGCIHILKLEEYQVQNFQSTHFVQ